MSGESTQHQINRLLSGCRLRMEVNLTHARGFTVTLTDAEGQTYSGSRDYLHDALNEALITYTKKRKRDLPS